MAGIDARSLLARAVGAGLGGGQDLTVERTNWNRLGGSGKNVAIGGSLVGDGGDEAIWLRLKPYGEGDWGLSADVRVAGIAEVGVRVCLKRCNSSRLVTGVLPPLGATAGKDPLEEKVDGRNQRRTSSLGHGNKRDIPPLTLKLELISIQRGSCHAHDSLEKQSHTTAASAALSTECDDGSSSGYERSVDYSSSRGSSNERSEHPRQRISSSSSSGTSGTSSGTSSGSQSSLKNRNENADVSNGGSGGGSNSDHSEWSKRTDTTVVSSNSFAVENTKGAGKTGQRSSGRHLNNVDPCNDGDATGCQQEYQCDVRWCGKAIGGTRAPLVGLPTPRWEGQVFYLPLCEAETVCRGRMVAAKAFKNDTSFNDGDRGRAGGGGGSWNCFNRGARETGPEDEIPPPLLTITLNRLSLEANGGVPCKNSRENDRKVEHCPSSTGNLPWLAFLSGSVDPSAVGWAVLEAGDVLSMLGSQQVRVCQPRVESRIFPGCFVPDVFWSNGKT